MTDPIQFTRQELYDRVWSTPAWKLGPELGMSSRGLAKLCAREGIPVADRQVGRDVMALAKQGRPRAAGTCWPRDEIITGVDR